MHSPETELCPQIEDLNRYIDRNLKELPDSLPFLKQETPCGYEELNRIFLSIINNIT
jgi:hypothetical protein